MGSPLSLLVGCALIGAGSIPLILRMVPPNPFYGVRTRKTLSDRELWFRANYFAGWTFLIASATSGVLVIFAHGLSRDAAPFELVAFLGPLVLAVAASLMYVRKL